MCLAMENSMRQVYEEAFAKGCSEALAEGYSAGFAKAFAKGRNEVLAKGAVRMGVWAGMTAKDIVDVVVDDYGVDREHVEELIRAQGA